MTRSSLVFRSLLAGGWVLLMPPVPLGTSLPPLSEWSAVSRHKTSQECELRLEAMREEARRTVTNDPNASALQVATGLGQLQASCADDGKPAAAPIPASGK